MKNTIFVTEPSLPPLAEFIPYLEEIWENKWLTNNGQFHQQFEQALAEYLGVRYVSLFTNGMIALQIGLQALRITGEVITTPFTFVATTHAIHWNSCTPVFCDIDPVTYNLDADKLESLITPKTTAIMPVHVYGNPCNVEKLQRIADTYGLKLFYDAAHAFGVRTHGESVLNFGDLSMLSFHATKVFNTFEGGALITNEPKLKQRIDFLKNFGFAGETTVVAPGANGKMDEFRAAFGLLQLKHIDEEIAKTRRVAERYRAALAEVPGITLMEDLPNVVHNYGYFPILVDEVRYGLSRDALYDKLKANGYYGRRYFYPLSSQFPSYRHLPSAEPGRMPVAEAITERVICLPIFANLADECVDRIAMLIKDVEGEISEGNCA
ncbi:DegT/DnrJ/EryC1/StrS family aminotransferase [Desulfosediminicola flagellatus]|uniref:DegT/DnrJ/EryC1/StrS family aminotransferase n=1 Tax=Desulfosediminicola flagellatus TaxID=2569541 RepID=UPI0010ABF7F4|nr:DegT/DnrJ/EryC1/StrS family aminotransferase [Desulfosediminicola flagellatus]